MKPALILVVAPALLASCSGTVPGGERAATADEVNPYAGYTSALYAGPQNWLCRPDLTSSANACIGDQSTTLVQADGSSAVEEFVSATDPQVDCFYVYPTTSADPTINSDFRTDVQETETTLLQAGRYGSVCRLYAPVYRQRTLIYLALDSAADPLVTDEQIAQANEIAYADVVDAFREYIANHNHGRGFLLLGHSQGARIGARLLAEEVEQHPYLQERLIAAHIPGYAVAVPHGQDTGGTLESIPACRDATQTGCVVNFSSYRQGDPQLDDPRFGVTGDPATHALCTNPAALAGGVGVLEAYLPFRLPPVFQALLIPRGSLGPYYNPVSNVPLILQTPFFAVPGQITAECVVSAGGAHYLEVRIAADPDDPRADDYPGEFIGGTGWGLHLADVSIAQGNLVALARSQAAAWMGRSSP